MDREEILARSRAENKNQDVYKQEVMRRANYYAMLVTMILAVLFYAVQIVVGGGMNYGLFALVFTADMTLTWIEYKNFRQKKALLRALLLTALVLTFSAWHIYNLISTSTIL